MTSCVWITSCRCLLGQRWIKSIASSGVRPPTVIARRENGEQQTAYGDDGENDQGAPTSIVVLGCDLVSR